MNTPTPGASTAPHTNPPPDVTGRADGDQLARVRHGVRAVLALGVTASVAANVLAARPDVVGRVIAAWPPVALLLTIELISRVPVTRPWLSAARVVAAGAVAGIAAWASYWHMVTVATRVGESASSAHLVPLSVDGMVVVASVCLVELADRSRTPATAPAADADHGTHEDTTAVPALAVPAPSPALGESDAVRPASPRRAARASDTGAVVRRLRERHPDWTVAQIAARAGISDRQARRHLNTPTTSTALDPSAATAAEMTEVAA